MHLAPERGFLEGTRKAISIAHRLGRCGFIQVARRGSLRSAAGSEFPSTKSALHDDFK
jgi:hypothetical protein